MCFIVLEQHIIIEELFYCTLVLHKERQCTNQIQPLIQKGISGISSPPKHQYYFLINQAAASSRSCFAAGICSPSHRCDHAGSNPSNELGWNACREKIIAKLYHESNQINHVRSIACISNYSDPSQPINQSLEGGANICEEERHEPRPYLKNSVPLQGARGMVFPSLFVLRRVFV